MTSIKDNQNTVKARIQKVVAQYIAEKLAYYVWLQTGASDCDKNMHTAELIQNWCLTQGKLLESRIPMKGIIRSIEKYCSETNICGQFNWLPEDVENFFTEVHGKDENIDLAKEVLERATALIVEYYLLPQPQLY